MTDAFKAACVQNCAGPDMTATIARSVDLVHKARDKGADLIALPEFFSCLHVGEGGLETGAVAEADHPALPIYQKVAQDTGAWIMLGSLGINDGGARLRNRTFVMSPDGEIAARYDKIHMFDVELGNGESYRESDRFEPGTEAVVTSTPFGQVGLSICYDLRFAYLYRSLAHAGAQILAIPAAFMRTTGQAHWHTLCRARAIETGCYVIAPCQSGEHGRAVTYGHSLIIDPWGEVLADGSGENEDVIIAEIDLNNVDVARAKVPALNHDRDYQNPDAANLTLKAGE
ncbi:MAG: carbon-nitrogen hydrolase family protein [Rhodospirillales bacterium]|jgi:deaminated glutathione amidase|nr:carbon-nitrogen hydrolase family protein [Rhodospirillales bacterium]MBT4040968.1 carbon-nitrogen hydrolase family protein [Rhodospirillales bacterium]MBT4625630.1 carbon-nitrogen hydrolase family protein [Rhodospirillales bacterium]MBT5350201.1 carbon-nitrogen hydrolase family protein [Rhodospirillales bacterium]MBT5522017.1 carbon-nitrogen hydrolase family protein [Rhodospirillales bacterium]